MSMSSVKYFHIYNKMNIPVYQYLKSKTVSHLLYKIMLNNSFKTIQIVKQYW